jgi:primase-polymerase (primpol)-like protein
MDAVLSDAGSKPRTHNGDIAAPPAALARLCAMQNWLIFRWMRNGSDKWTKPPFQSLCPSRMARNNDCETWSSHAAAVEAVKAGEADGIGFVLTGTDFAAVDLDRCRDPITGKIDGWAQAIIDRAPGAYCEITVSGTGLRLIGTGSGEKAHTSFKVEGAWPCAKLEIFRRAVRYITVSGLQIGACSELTNIDDLIDDLIAQHA